MSQSLAGSMTDFSCSEYNFDLLRADEIECWLSDCNINPREIREIEWLTEDLACLSRTYFYPVTSEVSSVYSETARISTVIQKVF